MALALPFASQLTQGGASQLRNAATTAAPPTFQPKILILLSFLSFTVALSCAKIKIQESFSPLRASPTFMEIRCALNFQQRSWIPDCIEVIKSGKIFRALTFLELSSVLSQTHIFLTLCHLAYDLSKKKFFATKEGKDLRFRVKKQKGGEKQKYIREIFHCVKLSVSSSERFCTVNEKSLEKPQLL